MLVPIMKRAKAIIADHGGRTSHAAIVSRELGLPAVVGAGDATHVLHDDQEVTVSCAESDEGYVYEGSAEVKHLYIERAARGIGIGRRLMRIAFNQLSVDGHKKVGLAVVKENAAARAFYSMLGGVEINSFVDPGPLWKSDNILVSWSL